MTETTTLNRFRRSYLTLRNVLYLLIAIAAYTLGWQSGVGETTNDFKAESSKLQRDNQRLTSDKSGQATQITSLQDQLKALQARLDAVMGPVGTFDMNSNKSMVIAVGRLTLGLVGSPTNDRAIINVDSKQQSMATGDVVSVQLATTCQVELKSFEMLKAVVMTTCTETK